MKAAISTKLAIEGRVSLHGGGSIATPPPPVDTTPPAAPTGVVAYGNIGSVGLEWNAVSDAAFYQVYRGGVIVFSHTNNSYGDVNVFAGTTYSYFVRAVDAAGNISPNSATVTATPTGLPDTTPPTVPSGVNAPAIGNDGMTISWTGSTDANGPISYEVFRDEILIATVTGTSVYDGKLSPGTYYQYRVRAVDYYGNRSAFSPAVSIRTTSPPQADKRFGVRANSTRDPLLWSFDALAPCNVPIGSGANLVACPIVFIESGANAGGVATRLRGEQEILFMDKNAGLKTIKFNCYGWGGNPGCSEPDRRFASTPSTWNSANWFADFQAPCPDNFIVPSNGENNCAVLLGPDGTTLYQIQPYCHWQAGGDHTSLVRFQTLSITGQSVLGSHGGSNIGALPYAILYGEITNAIANGLTYLSHGLKLNLDAHRFYYYPHSPGYAWPAAARDGYANSSTYGGTNPYCVPGALLTLPSSFNVSSLSTVVGRIIAETIKRFGIILVDDTTWNMVAIGVEDGPRGSVITELANLPNGNAVYLNYDPPSLSGGNAFYQDLRTMFANFYVVTNNSPTTINGGGSYLYGTPAAPTIGI